jgi:hypothetical protein
MDENKLKQALELALEALEELKTIRDVPGRFVVYTTLSQIEEIMK